MQGKLSMNYKVKTIPNFDKALKRLTKKYPSLKAEDIALPDSLEANSEQGIAIGNCFKIRTAMLRDRSERGQIGFKLGTS
jgi:hypothetical protein